MFITTFFGLQRMNPFWTCELYDYIQRQKELFIYAIDRDTNRPIQIDAQQDLDYFEDYDDLTIFIEEKGNYLVQLIRANNQYKSQISTTKFLLIYSWNFFKR